MLLLAWVLFSVSSCVSCRVRLMMRMRMLLMKLILMMKLLVLMKRRLFETLGPHVRRNQKSGDTEATRAVDKKERKKKKARQNKT